LFSFRGGNKDEGSTVEDREDELSDLDLEDDDTGVPEQRNQVVSSVNDMWMKTPPITQAYVSASILLTVLVFVVNKNSWPEVLSLNWNSVVTRLQLWRPFTAFLFFGPFGLNYVLTIQFVWTYMAQLEKLHYNKPAEFFMLLVFGAITLMITYASLNLSTQFLGHNLSTFLVYIWARTFEGTDVNVMDMFMLKAELLPWFFCAQTYLLEGEIPFADLLGIVVGHLYHYIFLEKKMISFVPGPVRAFFESEPMKKKYERFKGDFE
jgi:Derlin-2/3